MRSAAGDKSRVEVELVVQVRILARITTRSRVGVANHVVEGQWLDRIRVGGIEIHVLGKAVRKEEVVARPTSRERGHPCGVELQPNFFAGTQDDELIVGVFLPRIISAISVAVR